MSLVLIPGKEFLFPPQLRLWRAKKDDSGFKILEEKEQVKKFAFIGVRSCELHDISLPTTNYEDLLSNGQSCGAD